MYQQQKRYNTAMDMFSGFKLVNCHGIVLIAGRSWRGSSGLKLQCIRNCHFF